MKYILVNDFSHLLKKKRLILIYLILIFSNLLFKIFDFRNILDDDYFITLGLMIDSNNYISIITYILNIMFTIYLFFSIYTLSFKNNSENIFLRISIEKWSFLKVLSMFLIIIFIKLFLHTTALLIFKIINIKIINNILFLLTDILLASIITLLTMILQLIINKNILNIVVLTVIILFSKYLNVVYLSNCLFLLFCVLIIFVLIYIILIRNLYTKLFERGE